MLKKILLLGAAIAAFAALAAPAAQAEGTVTNFLGEEAEHITALSENTISKTNQGGELVCETVELTLTKTEGKTGHYVLTGWRAQGRTGDHSDPECEAAPSGLPVKITSIGATVNLNGGGTGSATFSYTYDITHPTLGSIHCSFESSSAGTVTYTSTSDSVRIEGAMSGGPAPFCATAGTISGDFTVTDEFGEPTSIH